MVQSCVKWAQHTALGASAEHESGVAGCTNPYGLRTVCKKSLIQAEVVGGKSRAASLLTTMLEQMVLKAKPKLTKSTLSSRWVRVL